MVAKHKTNMLLVTPPQVHGYEELLTGLVAEACIDVCPQNPNNFNVDNVRIVKLMGGALNDSNVVKVRGA